jgi:DNA modification methylase
VPTKKKIGAAKAVAPAKKKIGSRRERRPTERSSSVAHPGTDNLPTINTYSDEEVVRALRAVNWNFSDSKTDYFAHGLHPYPAKFIPQIPRALVSLLSEPGDLVWDPFGGSGTTALETLLLGRRAVSTDLNPVAEVVGRAKTITLTPEVEFELSQFASELKMLSASTSKKSTFKQSFKLLSKLVPEIPNLENWFEPDAIQELAYLRLRINELASDEAIVIARAAFSKLILSASNQDGETRYARVQRSIGEGEVVASFSKQILSILNKLEDQSSHLQFRAATFHTADLRTQVVSSSDNALIQSETVDLVVTSPPYPNATDYHLYHRFRIFWLGHDPRQMALAEIGSHLRHQKQGTDFDSYIEEMTAALDNVCRALKPGGLAVFVVGDAVFKGDVFQTSTHLGTAAESLGMRVVAVIDRDLPENKRSFISAARRLRKEQLLVLRKPSAERTVTLQPPTYKLQPYEDELRRGEVETLLGNSDMATTELSATVDPSRLRLIRRLAFSANAQTVQGGFEKTWQARLENGDSREAARSGRKKDPKYVTHGIHPYKGKFYPQLAKALMNRCGAEPGQIVLDPFCGSGTVLLEASLGGLNSVGFDVNPVAVATAIAKTAAVHADAVYRDHLLCSFERKLHEFANGKKPHSDLPYSGDVTAEIESWFPTNVIPMLAQVMHEVDLVPDDATKQLLHVLLSSIIREVSHQDPRDLRIRRRAEPLDSAPVYELMIARSKDARGRLRHFAKVANCAPALMGTASVVRGDSSFSGVVAAAAPEQSIDLIVTSPPYATALPYIDTDRLSLLVCHGLSAAARKDIEEQLIGSREIRNRIRDGLDSRIEAADFDSTGSAIAAETIRKIYRLNKKSDVGFRRKNTAALLLLYFEKMQKTVRSITPSVKLGGSAFVVIGDTRTTAGDKDVPIRSGAVIQEQFHQAGWETENVFPITVTRENVVHSKNAITNNEIYWFVKR